MNYNSFNDKALLRNKKCNKSKYRNNITEKIF